MKKGWTVECIMVRIISIKNHKINLIGLCQLGPECVIEVTKTTQYASVWKCWMIQISVYTTSST